MWNEYPARYLSIPAQDNIWRTHLYIVFNISCYVCYINTAASFQYEMSCSVTISSSVTDDWPHSVPDLPLCLGVFKHRAPLGRGYLSTKNYCLRWIFAYMVQFFFSNFMNMCADCLCITTGSTSFRSEVRGLIT